MLFLACRWGKGSQKPAGLAACRHGDVLQVEVLPALRSPWLAQQDSSALLLAAGEKGPAILTNPCRIAHHHGAPAWLSPLLQLDAQLCRHQPGPCPPTAGSTISCLHLSCVSAGGMAPLTTHHTRFRPIYINTKQINLFISSLDINILGCCQWPQGGYRTR